MVEWSITAVLKTAVLRGTGGSNPSLSAIKGVNQAFARFTPFFTPKNVKLGVFVFLRFFKRMSITKRLVFLWTGRMNLYDEKYSYSKK